MGSAQSAPCYDGVVKRVPERLTANARALRTSATKEERTVWRLISRYRPKFTRQLVIGPFIADCACREARLIVEIDGGQHADSEADEDRTPLSPARGLDCNPFLEQRSKHQSRGRGRGNPVKERRVTRRHPPPAPPFQGGEAKASAIAQIIPLPDQGGARGGFFFKPPAAQLRPSRFRAPARAAAG